MLVGVHVGRQTREDDGSLEENKIDGISDLALESVFNSTDYSFSKQNHENNG